MNLHSRVDGFHLLLNSKSFRSADPFPGTENLTIEIGFIENIAINDNQPANPDSAQELDHCSAKPARSDHSDFRLSQFELILKRNAVSISQVAARIEAKAKRRPVDIKETQAQIMGNGISMNFIEDEHVSSDQILDRPGLFLDSLFECCSCFLNHS
jgi:hypothetical protein